MNDVPPQDPPSFEQVIEERLVRCGLDAAAVSVEYDDDTQDHIVLIDMNAGANEEMFPCIREATDGNWVQFADDAMMTAYMDHVVAFHRPRMLAESEASLSAKGLLSNFPRREQYASILEYIRALEEHAGIEPGQYLQKFGEDGVTLLPPSDNSVLPEDQLETLTRLIEVVGYASLLDDLQFSLIGNERAAED